MPSPINIIIGAQTADAVAKLNGFIGGLQGKLAGLAGTVTAALSASQLIRFTQAAIETADQMGKLAQKTGIAVESMSRLSYAAKIGDVDAGELQVALKELSNEMVKAGESGKSVEEKLLEIAKEFERLPDGAQKSARAVEVFGRSGTAMIPFLNEGADGIRKLMKEADELGLVVGPQFSANADEFNDNLTRKKFAFQGLFLQIADRLLPVLLELQQSFLEFAKNAESREAAIAGMVELFKRLTTFGLGVAQAFQQTVIWLSALLSLMATQEDGFAIWKDAIESSGKAWERFQRLVNTLDRLGDSTDEATAAAERHRGAGQRSVEELKKELEARRKKIDLQIQDAQLSAAVSAADLTKPERQRNAEIRSQLELIDRLIQKKQQLTSDAYFSNGPGGEELPTKPFLNKDQADAYSREDRGQQAANQQQINQVPNDTFVSRMSDNLRQLSDDWDQVGAHIADVTTNTIGSAIKGVADSIAGMIDGTTNWGRTFLNVAKQIVSNIISIALQWVVSMTLIAALKKLFKTADTTEAVSTAAAWSPAAIAASTASFGSAAVAGGLAFGVALVAGTAIATALSAAAGSFAQGGLVTGPGTGTSDSILARLSNREYVIPSHIVESLGVPFLDNLRAGGSAATAANAAGSSPGGGSSPRFKVGIIRTRQELREFMEEEGVAMFYDDFGRRRADYGLGT